MGREYWFRQTPVAKRHAARRDFSIHYAYIGETTGLDVAKRFREAIESAHAQLAETPRMGAPAKVRQRKHSDIRIWRVREFEEHLIAYKPRRGGVGIERIIHAKQDYRRILK
jgi:plasmid stabilization system protein ParE